MTFSTDYVFDGGKRTPYHEDDCPAPLQIYGISKLAGEAAALATAPELVTIVRTCGLYGRTGAASKGGNFVDKRVMEGQREASIEISCDQTICPTSTHDLSKAVYALVAMPRASGVYHLVNEGECTWFEFTKVIYQLARIKTQVRPIDREGRTGTMRRPLYSVLANTRARTLGITLPSWQNALRRYLRENRELSNH
jgi:dTDP-4-dehydrorhamnose reductase